MKKHFIALIASAVMALAASTVEARDLGPQAFESTISTNNSKVDLPIGETGRFTPEALIFSGLPASTQAISYVASGYTGVISAASTASLVWLTNNIPTMFYGDHVRVVPNGLSGTNTFKVKVIGRVFD